jgi:hypothetical protein
MGRTRTRPTAQVFEELDSQERILVPRGLTLPAHRVTKGMGKRLRVTIESTRSFTWDELRLTLVDLTTGRPCPEMVSFPHKSSLKVTIASF